LPRIGSGIIGSGGRCSTSHCAVTSAGTRRVSSRNADSTGRACPTGQYSPPAYTSAAGTSRIVSAVTTPKFGPPPHTAQNRSGSVSRSTRRSWPSAVTMSTTSTESAARPKRRTSQPLPPPRQKPTAPSPEVEPDSGAWPCGAAASTTSRQRAPAPVTAVPAAASMLTWFNADVSISTPAVAAVSAPCPVACTRIRSPSAPAIRTTDSTSVASLAATTSAGACLTSWFHEPTRCS
jgi:hypothetical protein